MITDSELCTVEVVDGPALHRVALSDCGMLVQIDSVMYGCPCGALTVSRRAWPLLLQAVEQVIAQRRLLAETRVVVYRLEELGDI